MSTELAFEYEVTRSKRKTLAIYVRDGKADVRVPLRAPKYYVESFIKEREQWVLDTIEEQRNRDAQRFKLIEGEEIFYLGEPVVIRYLPAGQKDIYLHESELFLPAPDLFTDIKAEFKKWLKQQAKLTMEPLAWEAASLILAADRLKRVRFRQTKTMWGHCTSEGVVQFNPLIMLGPDYVIEYLVAHEVSHLLHMNHSKSFWRTVERISQDRKPAKQWLKQNEHRLMGVY